MLIALDPGHGGPTDRGARYAGVDESDANLRQAYDIRAILAALGHEVVMHRMSNIRMSHRSRAARSRDVSADATVIIHHNAGPQQLRGLMTFSWRECHTSRALAVVTARCAPEPLYRSARRMLTVCDEPSHTWLLRPAAVLREYSRLGLCAILLEVGYLSNDVDRAAIERTDVRAGVGMAVACGVQSLNGLHI